MAEILFSWEKLFEKYGVKYNWDFFKTIFIISTRNLFVWVMLLDFVCFL